MTTWNEELIPDNFVNRFTFFMGLDGTLLFIQFLNAEWIVYTCGKWDAVEMWPTRPYAGPYTLTKDNVNSVLKERE